MKLADVMMWVPVASMLAFGLGVAYRLHEDKEMPQAIVECYSGGHLIFEEMCEECAMFSGYVGGVNLEGQKFHSNADCVIVQAGY